MPSEELNNAIQLIQAGQNEQAQSILQGLIRVNQQDLEAWSWYVRSCRTPEKRLETLELCLRFNPGNAQITEAIQKLREKLTPPPPPVVRFEPAPISSLAAQTSPYDYDDTPEPEPPAWDARVPEPMSFPLTYEKPNTPEIKKFTSVDTNLEELDERPGRPLMWYEVWWMALTQPNLPTYDALLRDPMQSMGRTFWWTFLSSILTWLIIFLNVLINPETRSIFTQMQGATNMAVFFAFGMFVFVFVGAFVNIILLMINAGFFHLLAKAFGGIGTFSRVLYLKAAYNAPFSIASTLLSVVVGFIPCVNLILPILLELYYLRLDILSIQAAHRLNGGRATIVVLLPTFALCLLSCVLLILASSLVPGLEQMLRQRVR